MMRSAVVAILVIVFLMSVLLDKTYRSLPTHELRRRARAGKDKNAAAIYKMAAYGHSLKILLWLIGVGSATALLLLASRAAWWLGLAAALVLGWTALAGRRPFKKPSGWPWKIAAALAPALSWLLSYLQPLFGRIAEWLKNLEPLRPHTGLYEKEDLLELLDRQSSQADNRLTELEIKAARGVLEFNDKTVGSVMSPRRGVKFVAASDPISPRLMDELHATGFKHFPVVKEITPASSKATGGGEPHVLGILYLNDLLKNLEKPGKISDLMKKDAHFINETHTLPQALDAFLKSHHHLLVVVNNFEEVVGVLTLDDVLEQITGQKITDEFDRYDDLRAVAGHNPTKDQAHHEQIAPSQK